MNYTLELVKRNIKAMKERFAEKPNRNLDPVILMPRILEDDLMYLLPEEIGQDLVTSLLIDGPRETFLVMYGIPVIYDEPEFKIIDLSEVTSDIDRKRLEQLRDMTMEHHRSHFQEHE